MARPGACLADDPLDGRLPGTALRCVLALMLVLAPPVASLAWLAGAHATIEQVAFHEESLEHEHVDHHGTHRHGVHEEPHAEPGSAGFVLSPSAASAGPSQDVLQGALARSPDESPPDGAQRLVSPNDLPPPQNFPLGPHRPPIPS